METANSERQPARLHYQHWPKGMPKSLALPRTSLFYNLKVSAQRYPNKPAVVFYYSPLSYRQLHEQAEALAGFLSQQCGVQRGAVIWEVTGGDGKFRNAQGLITSNFTVNGSGEVIDDQFARLFIAE